MADLTFKGVWDPTIGAHPIPEPSDGSCYYIVTQAGTLGLTTFEPGDWLVYIESSQNEPDGSLVWGGNWYKSSGGIINIGQPVTDGMPNAAGTYTKVTVNEHGVVTTGTTLEATDIPTHEQDASTIIGLEPIIQEATHKLFENTVNSYAVEFKPDIHTGKIGADVKIDNITIGKDSYGRLQSLVSGVVKHEHEITDIPGLQDQLDSLSIPAENQVMTYPSSGKIDFFGMPIKDAIDSVHDQIKTVDEKVEKLRELEPVAPPNCSDMVLELDPEIELHDGILLDTFEPIKVTTDRIPRTKITPRFGTGSTGNLSATVDGVVVGAVTLTEEDNSGKIGYLDITENTDFYLGEPAYQNWYTSIRARIAPQASLLEGLHEFALHHSLTGSTTPMKVFVANTQTNPTIQQVMAFSKTPAVTGYKSGVPITANNDFEIDALEVHNASTVVYNKNCVQLSAEFPFELEDGTIVQPQEPVIIPTDYARPFGEHALSYSTRYIVKPLIDYSEQIVFKLRGIGIFNQLGAEYSLGADTVQVDAIPEVRVTSGDPSVKFPIAEYGRTWDSEIKLHDSIYDGELQQVADYYRWPSGDYSKLANVDNAPGPDYTASAGYRIEGLGTAEYRWVTFQLQLPQPTASFDLNIQRREGEEWELLKNGVIHNMLISIKGTTTPWMDANKPFTGIQAVDTEGEGCLDVGESEGNRRHITMGKNKVLSGAINVRIGIARTSNYEFLAPTISNIN